MSTQITILGAGFAGLELSSFLSESLGSGVQVTLIDAGDSFVFGFSKLDVMFGHKTLDEVRLPYRNFSKPGVRLLKESVTAIDPVSRRVTTNAGRHDCDYLVVALGAGYDFAATPGLAEGERGGGRGAGSDESAAIPRERAVGHSIPSCPFECGRVGTIR